MRGPKPDRRRAEQARSEGSHIHPRFSDVNLVFSVASLSFEGDLPASIFHMKLIEDDIAAGRLLRLGTDILTTSGVQAPVVDAVRSGSRGGGYSSRLDFPKLTRCNEFCPVEFRPAAEGRQGAPEGPEILGIAPRPHVRHT